MLISSFFTVVAVLIVAFFCYGLLLVFFEYIYFPPVVTRVSTESLVKYSIGFFSSVAGVHWHHRRVYASQWKYCADLYNEIIKIVVDNYKNEKIKNRLILALCIDLIDLDMWAHKSFSEMFKNEIFESIDWLTKTNPKECLTLFNEVDFEKIKFNIISEGIYEDQAKEVLLAHLSQILDS